MTEKCIIESWKDDKQRNVGLIGYFFVDSAQNSNVKINTCIDRKCHIKQYGKT